MSSRALDIGCAVGRSSFELAREIEEVVGIDFSHSFVDACNELRHTGQMDYDVTAEGTLLESYTAFVDSNLVQYFTSRFQSFYLYSLLFLSPTTIKFTTYLFCICSAVSDVRSAKVMHVVFRWIWANLTAFWLRI